MMLTISAASTPSRKPVKKPAAIEPRSTLLAVPHSRPYPTVPVRIGGGIVARRRRGATKRNRRRRLEWLRRRAATQPRPSAAAAFAAAVFAVAALGSGHRGLPHAVGARTLQLY